MSSSTSSTNVATGHHSHHSHHHRTISTAAAGATKGFLDSLNAKLAQNHGLTQQKASKVRQLINSKAQVHSFIVLVVL